MRNKLSYKIFCPSNRPELAKGLSESLGHEQVEIITNMPGDSFSSLCNRAFITAREDIVVIANDKARPSRDDLQRLLLLIESGFGFVGLYRMGFFGCRRDIFQALGGFDEGFSDGGYEDNDLLIRLKVANLSTYYKEEISYIAGLPSSWPQTISRMHFFRKYSFHLFSKIISAQSDIGGEDLSVSFGVKPWSHSQLGPTPLATYRSRFEAVLLLSKILIKPTGIALASQVVVGLLKNIQTLGIPHLLERSNYRLSRDTSRFTFSEKESNQIHSDS